MAGCGFLHCVAVSVFEVPASEGCQSLVFMIGEVSGSWKYCGA